MSRIPAERLDALRDAAAGALGALQAVRMLEPDLCPNTIGRCEQELRAALDGLHAALWPKEPVEVTE